MSNEIKVAILAIVAIALSYWGYKFIMGKNVLKDSNVYYIEYDTVNGMNLGTSVQIYGLNVGFVADMKPLYDKEKVQVTIDLNKDVSIPKDTRADIISTGFMGGKAIALTFDRPCSGADCAQSGDKLRGTTKGLLGSMLGPDNAEMYVDIVKDGMSDMIDSLNHKILNEDAEGALANSFRNLDATLENLKNSTGQLNGLLYRSSDNISGTMENLDKLSKNLADNNDRISSILASTDNFTGQLDSVDLKETLQEIEATVSQLKSALAQADQAFSGINTVVGGIQEGEGTLGKLLQDEGLYNDLNGLSTRIDSLVTDFQERPYRYMPLKSRRKVLKYDRKDENM